jgi:hypothetical protein
LGWILLIHADSLCGFSPFVGLEDCYTRPDDFGKLPFTKVIASNAFQAISKDQQLQWVQEAIMKDRDLGREYSILSPEQRLEVAAKMLVQSSPNRLLIATKHFLIIFVIGGIGFLLPWSLVRLCAWVIVGFKADRLPC